MGASTCPHCGRDLRRRYVDLNGTRVPFGYEPCGCAGAIAEREAEESRRHEAEAAEEARKASERLRRTGIPARYRAATVPELPPVNAWLYGSVGTGKTHAACARAVAESDAGRVVRFATMADVAARVRSTYGRRSEQAEDDVVSPLIGCDLLVLDDLGRERETEWSLALLWRVVDGRYGREADVLVTSNYSRGRLAGRLAAGGDEVMARAIVSRLAEMTVPVHMDGRDRRLS